MQKLGGFFGDRHGHSIRDHGINGLVPAENKPGQPQQRQVHQRNQLVSGQGQPLSHKERRRLDTVHWTRIGQHQTGSGTQEDTAGQSGQRRVLHQGRKGMQEQGDAA
ncbi:hypothetical protein D3C81_2030080 [compost metagenome]